MKRTIAVGVIKQVEKEEMSLKKGGKVVAQQVHKTKHVDPHAERHLGHSQIEAH